jgi:hypothetical protein
VLLVFVFVLCLYSDIMTEYPCFIFLQHGLTMGLSDGFSVKLFMVNKRMLKPSKSCQVSSWDVRSHTEKKGKAAECNFKSVNVCLH